MKEKILVIDDQEEVRTYLGRILAKRGYEVLDAGSPEEGLHLFQEKHDSLSLAILDLDLGQGTKQGLSLLSQIKSMTPEVPVIILTGKGTIPTAVKALKAGAADFLEKDAYIAEHLEASMEKIKALIQVVEENKRLRARVDFFQTFFQSRYQMVGRSALFQEVLTQARRLASIPRPVLIRGERGTGKELLAAYIHHESDRSEGPFITINCVAIPPALFESEMFGYEKGAFTGATSDKVGRFEMAHRGTLFLDEVANMPLDFQAKILRVIEYQRFERVQGTKTIEVDVRIIAATNADLEEMMQEGKLRRDFYDRLAFDTIMVPPLRERPEDIEPLVEHFIEEIVKEVPGLQPKRVTAEAMAKLKSYPWPGNVRELKNAIERAVCFAAGEIISPEDIYLTAPEAKGGDGNFKEKVDQFQKSLLLEALARTKYNQKKAAAELGLSYDQFRHWYRKFSLGG
jgi:DNA-binding NtrC family response regulator